MKYFDGEFRKALMELLLTIRKLLEQSAIGSKDQNFTILINDIIKKIDEYSKIVKPAFFDFLEVSKIQKLQEDEFLKKKAEELEQSFEERVKAETEKAVAKVERSIRERLESEFDARLDSEKAMLSEQLSASIGAKTEKALAKTYAERTSALEEEYAEKSTALEEEYSKKSGRLEKEYAEKAARMRAEYEERIRSETEKLAVTVRQEVIAELTIQLTEKLRAELTEEIKEELRKKREEKKKRKKAKKAEMMAEQNLPENAVPVPSSETEKTEAEIVNFRMTPKEKKKLLAKAEEAHMSLSGYIIALSKSKRVVLKDEIAELTVEISRIGNNINQIAHTGNSQKFLYKAQLNDVVKHLQAIEDLQRKILMAMFSDEEHTIITVEKKIDRLTERMENLTERIDNIGGS